MGDPFATMGNVTPSTRAIAHEVVAAVIAAGLQPPHTIWGMGGPPEHSTGNAIDLMVPLNSPSGDFMADYIWANGERFGLNWVIWKQRIRNPQRGDGWRGMEDRGDTTQNHYDHVHAFFNGGGSVDGTAVAPVASNPDATPLPAGSAAPSGGGGGGGGGGAPTGAGAPSGGMPAGSTQVAGSEPAPDATPGAVEDEIQFAINDLRADAALFSSLQSDAATLADSFRALGSQSVDWGLHEAAAAGLGEGAESLAGSYASAARIMVAISDGLHDSADDYRQTEDHAARQSSAIADGMGDQQ